MPQTHRFWIDQPASLRYVPRVNEIQPIQFSVQKSPVVAYLASLAKGSREAQRWALEQIVRICASEATIYEFQWQALTPTVVSLLQSKLTEEYKYTTTNRIMAALRGVITAYWRNGLIDAETKERLLDFKPVRGSSVPKGRHISTKEVSSMAKSADLDTVVGCRDAAILALIASTGLRRAEVVTIDLEGYSNVSGHGKSVTVLGKGNKQRSVAVPSWAQNVLDEWVEKRGEAEGPLFVPIARGGGLLMRRMSPATVALAVKQLAHAAGITKVLTTHDFRRTYVSNLLDAGVDLAVVQRMVGHSDPKITARYDRRGKSAEHQAAELLDDPMSKE